MKDMNPDLPSDMCRRKKYNRCNCGFHSVRNKPKWSNAWRVRNGIRLMRKAARRDRDVGCSKL